MNWYTICLSLLRDFLRIIGGELKEIMNKLRKLEPWQPYFCDKLQMSDHQRMPATCKCEVRETPEVRVFMTPIDVNSWCYKNVNFLPMVDGQLKLPVGIIFISINIFAHWVLLLLWMRVLLLIVMLMLLLLLIITFVWI